MTITKKTVSAIDHRVNTFGQLTRSYDTAEETTATGTLDELIAHSFETETIIKRIDATAHLFPVYMSDAKYAVLYNGKATSFADRLSDYGDDVLRALRYHKGEIV